MHSTGDTELQSSVDLTRTSVVLDQDETKLEPAQNRQLYLVNYSLSPQNPIAKKNGIQPRGYSVLRVQDVDEDAASGYRSKEPSTPLLSPRKSSMDEEADGGSSKSSLQMSQHATSD